MAEHWFVRIAPKAFNGVRVLLALVSSSPTVIAVIKGMPLEIVAGWAMAGIVSTLVGLYYILRLGDYVEGQGVNAKLGMAFADELEERAGVGDATVTTARASEIIGQADGGRKMNTKFRWIKNIVDAGYVWGQPLNENDQANRDTLVRVRELASFFRRKDWRRLVDRAS
jgi:hypothetical protein